MASLGGDFDGNFAQEKKSRKKSFDLPPLPDFDDHKDLINLD